MLSTQGLALCVVSISIDTHAISVCNTSAAFSHAAEAVKVGVHWCSLCMPDDACMPGDFNYAGHHEIAFVLTFADGRCRWAC